MTPGAARLALLRALQSGVCGAYEAFARHAGISPNQARRTLCNMRREGLVVTHPIPADAGLRSVGRPRVLYQAAGPLSAARSVDPLAFVRQVWR